MIIPIKRIILETMMTDQDKFSVITGALSPTQTMSHNAVDIKPNISDIELNKHKYGFVSHDEGSHLHNNHLTPGKMAQYNNDLTLINKINTSSKGTPNVNI